MEPSGNPKSVNAGKLVETLVSRFETRNYFAIKKRGKEKGRRGRGRITKRCKRGFGERDMAEEEESTATI